MSGASHFTVIGANGFVGSHIVRALAAQGETVHSPPKGDRAGLRGPLGHVIYCAGVTSDFRQRPFDTVDAHVCLLSQLLQEADFRSFTYLSSTRIYIHASSTAESADIPVVVSDPGDLFNLSKLMGEAICRQSGREGVRAVRLSNVLGQDFQSGNFIFSLMSEAKQSGRIVLQTALDSEKDYIHIDDAVRLILEISRNGTRPVYNVATGYNLTNRAVVEEIRSAMPAELEIMPHAPSVRFCPIDVGLVTEEFGYSPMQVLSFVGALAALYRDMVSAP